MTGVQNPSTGVQGTHPLFKKKPGALPLATLAMVAVLSGASGCGTTQAPVDCTAAGVTCEHTDSAPQAAAADKAAADKAAADAQATADAQASADQAGADKATADKATTTAATSTYTFDCFGPDLPDGTPVPIQGATLAELWTQKVRLCSVTMDPSHQATAVETKAVKEYHLFNASETTQGALETMIGICAETVPDADEISRWSSHVLRGALMLCPKAPTAGQLASKTSGKTFEDGNWAVGIDVMPGTYRTAAGVHNCYWERTTKGGGTIANDFVSYAVEGVTVSINSTDGGFTSKNCGTWTRVN
jgi:hypothetical protein